jgi:hypothetical protein
MQQGSSPEPIGGHVGTKAIESAEERANQYCKQEQERIALANEPKLLALRAESQILMTKANKLTERIRNAPPPGDARGRRCKAFLYACLAGAFMLSGFYFTRLTFDPFRLGIVAWVVAGGTALAAPLFLHWFLTRWNSERLIRILVTSGCLFAFTSLVLLASIRGDLLNEQVRNTNASVTFNGDSAPVAEKESAFYRKNTGCLQLALALLAMAMEMAAGIAVFEACRYGQNSGDDSDELERELAEIQQRLINKVHEAKHLENEPREWANAFARDYHLAALNTVKRNGSKWFSLVLLCVSGLAATHDSAAEPLNIIVAVDLSASVTGAKGFDGKTEFDQNLAGVGRLLAAAPAGSRITVIGITGQSFTRPYVLLSAELDNDEGYFHERLAGAHQELVRAWQKRSASLVSHFQRTDLLGALLLTAQLLGASDTHRTMLVLFSDMRQDTSELNLDDSTTVDVAAAMAAVERGGLVPDLKGVEVYTLGADAAGKSATYWHSLRAFWTRYFVEAGATLRCYSMFREPPAFAPETNALEVRRK